MAPHAMNTPNCKCGRRWYASWLGVNRYNRRCPGCHLLNRDCTCKPLTQGKAPTQRKGTPR